MAQPWLLCRAGSRICAMPLDKVVETMRPLPVEAVAGAPSFVKGISVIRGQPVPVVDVAALLGDAVSAPRRVATIRAGTRNIALAFDEILGVQAIDEMGFSEFPPLLRDAANDAVAAIGSRDAELLVVLNEMHLLPDGAL